LLDGLFEHLGRRGGMIEPFESEHSLPLLGDLLRGGEPRAGLSVHLADDQQRKRWQLSDETVGLYWLQQPSQSLTRASRVGTLGFRTMFVFPVATRFLWWCHNISSVSIVPQPPLSAAGSRQTVAGRPCPRLSRLRRADDHGAAVLATCGKPVFRDFPHVEAVKKLGQAPSRPLVFQAFRRFRSEPVPFFTASSGTQRPHRRRKSAFSAASRLDCDTQTPPRIAPAGCPESGATVLAAPSTLGNAGRKRPAEMQNPKHPARNFLWESGVTGVGSRFRVSRLPCG
jgi:hypothetical protein